MHRFMLAATGLLVLAGGIERAHAAAYTLTTLQAPGFDQSGQVLTAGGVNDQGEVVLNSSSPGFYNTSNFLYTAGAITPIDLSGFTVSPNKFVTGINNNGQITGFAAFFQYGSVPDATSFIDNHGVFVTLPQSDNPTFQYSYNIGVETTGINDSGQVVGAVSYLVSSNQRGGGLLDEPDYFLYSGTTLNPLNIKGLGAPTGINDSGHIVGFGGVSDSAGVVTPITVPGALSTTSSAISNSGLVAGTFEDAAGKVHGFVDDNGTFSTFDAPSSAVTYDNYVSGINNAGGGVGYNSGFFVTGINNAGDVVGYYDVSDAGAQAFLATPTDIPEPASITLLGVSLAAFGFVVRRRRT